MPEKKKLNPQGKDIGTMLLEGLRQLPAKAIHQMLYNNPIARIAGMVGAASTYIPGQEGEGMRVLKQILTEAGPQEDKNKLNPMQENVLKAVQKVHTKNVEAAMEQGASGEQVLADAGISFGDDQPTPEVSETGQTQTDPLSLALTGQQPSELAGQFQRKGGFWHRPMQVDEGSGAVYPEQILGGLIKAHPDTTAQMLSNLVKGQEITGKKPLQKGEREKLGIEGLIDLAKAGEVDPLTPENAGKFQLLQEGLEATLTIDELLGNNVTAALFAQGVPNFLKSQNAKLLESAIERAVQGRTRIETGAALQPSELKSTAKRFMPKKGDSIDTALRRLKPLHDYFAGGVNIADPTGVHRQRAKGMTAQEVSAKITSFKEVSK